MTLAWMVTFKRHSCWQELPSPLRITSIYFTGWPKHIQLDMSHLILSKMDSCPSGWLFENSPFSWKLSVQMTFEKKDYFRIAHEFHFFEYLLSSRFLSFSCKLNNISWPKYILFTSKQKKVRNECMGRFPQLRFKTYTRSGVGFCNTPNNLYSHWFWAQFHITYEITITNNLQNNLEIIRSWQEVMSI